MPLPLWNHTLMNQCVPYR